MRDGLLKSIPHMRALAISLTGNIDRADDLVQEALAKGLAHLDSFQPGTNMRAWLFTILRNEFNTAHRKKRREVEDPNEEMATRLSSAPAQIAHLDFDDPKKALARLPAEQREALLLVSAEGCSYEEAARICETNYRDDQKPSQSRPSEARRTARREWCRGHRSRPFHKSGIGKQPCLGVTERTFDDWMLI